MNLDELKQINDELSFTLEAIKRESENIKVSDDRIRQAAELASKLNSTIESLKGELQRPVKTAVETMLNAFKIDLEKGVKKLEPIALIFEEAANDLQRNADAIRHKNIKDSVKIVAITGILVAAITGTVAFYFGHSAGLKLGSNAMLDRYGLSISEEGSHIQINGQSGEKRDIGAEIDSKTNQYTVYISKSPISLEKIKKH